MFNVSLANIIKVMLKTNTALLQHNKIQFSSGFISEIMHSNALSLLTLKLILMFRVEAAFRNTSLQIYFLLKK